MARACSTSFLLHWRPARGSVHAGYDTFSVRMCVTVPVSCAQRTKPSQD